MNDSTKDELVNYTLERLGRFFIIENVPAKVSVNTGEQFFSPSTVEELHKLILGDGKPARTIETPVFEYAA